MYIEKDVAASIDNKVIIQQFQNIKTCERKFKNFRYLSLFFCDVNTYIQVLFLLTFFKFKFLMTTLKKIPKTATDLVQS